MAFNFSNYILYKQNLQDELVSGLKSPYDLMQEYKFCIKSENYEKAKALTEVLAAEGYNTIDTHKYIKELS